MPEARWSDLAVAAAAADKPSSGSANPILTGPQAARRSAHKVQILHCYRPLLTPEPTLTPCWICSHNNRLPEASPQLSTLAACINCCRPA